MDVRLSPEQSALRDSAVRIVAHLGPGAVGALDDRERTGRLDAAVEAAGWRELRTAATDEGEPLASGVEVAIVAEALAKGSADTAFVGPTLAAELRRLVGAPAADTGETILVSPDLGRLARSDEDRAVAVDAAAATQGLGLDAQGDSWTLTTTPLGPGTTHVDLTRRSSSPAGPATPIADQQRVLTADDVDRVTALALASTCADLVGTMRGAVELAAGYAADRNQYGRPVGSFQAVQHLIADALVVSEGSASMALHAAWAVDALAPREAVVSTARAKAYAARSARTVCETAIQVHGGIGNTWECMAHVHLRRSLLSTELFGGIDANVARVLRSHEIEMS